MTLEEAITHALNQAEFFSVKSDCSLYDEAKRYSEYASEYKQLAEWLRELKELKEEFPYLHKSNEEIKKLLKLASADTGKPDCSSCVHSKAYCSSCLNCYNFSHWEWRFSDVVSKILGEGGQEE